MRNELAIIILISLGACINGQQRDLGSACIVENTGSGGTCKLLEECVPVINDIKNKIFGHTRCVPFATNGTEIICCPEVKEMTPGKRSEKKCDDYKSTVFEEVIIPASLGEPPSRILVNRCAAKSSPLIPNSSSSRVDYPHMALIGFNIDYGEIGWLCGGTLISDLFVLIGAHCSNSADYGPPLYVRLGELNVNRKVDEYTEDFSISAVIPHPDYDPLSIYNDIALVRLNRKVDLSPHKRPACLPTAAFDNVGQKAIFTGWGQDIQTGRSLARIKQLTVEILPTNVCNVTYAENVGEIMSETQICSGSREALKDFNDSGGPMQIYHPHQYCMYVVIGHASFGSRQPSENYEVPDVFTRIFPYIEWIENIVWENETFNGLR